jgi:predicted GTPase
MNRKRIYLIVGVSGSGKSTTSNSIINKSGDQAHLESPFKTSDGANACTLKFQTYVSEELTIIDTVGFCNSQIQEKDIIQELKKGLNKVNNRITHVIFVVKKGRFTLELSNFFDIVHEKILKNMCRYNSFILFTNCEKKWIDSQNDQYLRRALSKSRNLYYEYLLNFDGEDDEDIEKVKNKQKRQKAVEDFLNFLSKLQFSKVDISFD